MRCAHPARLSTGSVVLGRAGEPHTPSQASCALAHYIPPKNIAPPKAIRISLCTKLRLHDRTAGLMPPNIKTSVFVTAPLGVSSSTLSLGRLQAVPQGLSRTCRKVLWTSTHDQQEDKGVTSPLQCQVQAIWPILLCDCLLLCNRGENKKEHSNLELLVGNSWRNQCCHGSFPT